MESTDLGWVDSRVDVEEERKREWQGRGRGSGGWRMGHAKRTL